jgi:hypothetical protein
MPSRPRLAVVIAAVFATGCALPVVRPPVPAGWLEVRNDAGDLTLVLPPWLVTFEQSEAVFASEVPGDAGQGLQLLAEGPRTRFPQPGDEPLTDWLIANLESPVAGIPASRAMTFPGGSGAAVERIDAAGTWRARRILAYAIPTPFGMASLVIDGPLNAWAGRDAEADLIARLLVGGPGRREDARTSNGIDTCARTAILRTTIYRYT